MSELRQSGSYSIEKIRNLLKAAKVALKDAHAPAEYYSVRGQFNAANDAVYHFALALLESNHKEIDRQGHHQVVLQYIIELLKLRGNLADVVLPLAKLRNDIRYDGSSTITEDMLESAIVWAEQTHVDTERWFTENNLQALVL